MRDDRLLVSLATYLDACRCVHRLPSKARAHNGLRRAAARQVEDAAASGASPPPGLLYLGSPCAWVQMIYELRGNALVTRLNEICREYPKLATLLEEVESQDLIPHVAAWRLTEYLREHRRASASQITAALTLDPLELAAAVAVLDLQTDPPQNIPSTPEERMYYFGEP